MAAREVQRAKKMYGVMQRQFRRYYDEAIAKPGNTGDYLVQILERCRGDTWLCIENSAGAGAMMGRSLAELEVLLDALDRHPRLGVCLDSCHLYASGYDLTDRSVVDELVAELDARVGLERLRALHVNDSGAERGSNRARRPTD